MEQNQINLTELNRILDELAFKHWASSTELFLPEFCRQLAQECQRLHNQGAFHKAAIGRGATKKTNSEIRGDFTLWIHENTSSPLQRDLLSHLRILQEQLNQSSYLGLKRFETHFALYPPGAGYDKHVDNHRGSGARKITFILYLNEHWQEGHGGELSLFQPDNEEQLLERVAPRLGTFVIFRSELFPHQVEKSFQPRLSLTGWFRDDAS